jgi:formyltetrahydrofolate-dependent phosphoribosylglycinamide formyltransferase
MSARLAVMVSGNGSNLQAILDACAAGTIDATVELVVSNKAAAYGLERAAAADIPTAVVAPDPARPRREYDAGLAGVVAAARPDWVVLAGWMRILTSAFLDRFPDRVVNLHPALPGAFPGAHAIDDAWAAHLATGLDRTGVMIHLVPDEQVDAGPVLASEEVAILPGDTIDTLTARVHATEHRLLVATLTRLCSPQEVTR